MNRTRQKIRLGGRIAFAVMAIGATVAAQPSPAADEPKVDPLAAKEQMIKDRFDRFKDRIYALSVELSETEPANSVRLARTLERAGELGLSDQLDQIAALLDDAATLPQAVDAQNEWLADAERLLGILLERDSDNERRRSEIERLDAYRKQVGEILERQRSLRNEAGDATAAERLGQQIDRAMQRLDALQEAQEGLSEQSEKAADPAEREALAEEQEQLAEEAAELAEELERMGEPQSPSEQSPALQEAREASKSAGESTQSGSKSMSEAGKQMQDGKQKDAQSEQEQAEEALQEAKEKLQAAKDALDGQKDAQEQSSEQKALSQKTGELGDQMQQDAESGDGQSQPGAGQAQKSAQKRVQNAQEEMDRAAESLEQEKPDDATPRQDEAIEQLEEAKRELDEQLQQLRKEERAETLRDLEARFRDMLARQRPINEGTIDLHEFGVDRFGRAEKLQLAELSTQQTALSDDALACLHILHEEGTTIAFPQVVGQLAEDMQTSGERLAETSVGIVTQTIQQDIIDTLEQLLDAVKKMQQENEQQNQQAGDPQDGEPPLLPQSAELKLLRASQERVNTRTSAIESGVAQGEESPRSAESALKKLAVRQVECMEIAEDMRDQRP